MTITTISSGNDFSTAHFTRDRTDIVPSGGFTIAPRVEAALGVGASAAAVPVVSSGVVLSGPVVPKAFYQVVEKGGITVDAQVSGGSQFVFGRTTGTFIEASSNGPSEYDGRQVVEAGGRAVRTRIGEGGLQYISSGAAFGTAIAGGSQEVDVGLAEFTTVMNGDQTVYAGGSAIKTRVGAGGTQYIEGGLTSSTVVVNGGRQFIYSGTAMGTVVQKSGVEVVESGGVVSGLTVSSGGEVVIDDGGKLVDAHIAEGAIVFRETLSSGMRASSIVVSAYFSQTVLSGATATDTTVLSSGTVVLAGGSVTGLTVSSGGTEVVTNSVTVSGVTVGDGVMLNLISGATASGETVGRGGTEQVLDDAKTIDATVSGVQYVFDGGVAGKTTVASGGEQIIVGSQFFLSQVEAPGSASGTTVKAGGKLITSQGFIGGGGGVVIGGGGSIGGGGGVIIGSGGVSAANRDINPNSGGVIDVTIESGGVFIAGDGVVSGGTVESGGKIILQGATLSGLTVEKGGIEIVGSNGYLAASKGTVLSDVQVKAGGTITYAGGRFVGLSVSSGATETVASGVAIRDLTVGSGVTFFAFSGGTVSGIHVTSGGSIDLYGGTVRGLKLDDGAIETLGDGTSFHGITVSKGLTVRVAEGAILTDATVQAGGQIVYAGGVVSGLKLAKGARVGIDTNFTFSGPPASGITLYGGAYVGVLGGSQLVDTVVSGELILEGKTIRTQIRHGGYEAVDLGGVAKNTIVVGERFHPAYSGISASFDHSTLLVENGGIATGVAVAGWGILQVDEGGKAAGVKVGKGGTIVLNGGTVTGLDLASGGTEEVFGSAVVRSAKIVNGATIVVDDQGSAVNVTVENGGTIVDNGGSISGLKLKYGATEIIGSSGYAGYVTALPGVHVTVSSGGIVGRSTIIAGTETVLSGGVVQGAVTFGKGGRFAIAGEPVGLTVSHFHDGNHIDLTSFAPSLAEKLSFVENADKTKGFLKITDGTQKASITLFGQYVAAGFHLASDGAGGTVITYASSATAAPALAAVHH